MTSLIVKSRGLGHPFLSVIPVQKKQKGGDACRPPNDGAAGGGAGAVNLRRFFTTRKGNTFDAHDYGHKAWPIGRRK